MKRIDARGERPYSPLIPALMGVGEAASGETVEISLDNQQAFCDLKEYLSEQHIGFREVYDGDTMVIEFRKP